MLFIEEPPNRLLSDVLFLPYDRFVFCLSAFLSTSSSNSHTVSRERFIFGRHRSCSARVVIFCFSRAGDRAADPLWFFPPVSGAALASLFAAMKVSTGVDKLHTCICSTRLNDSIER